MCNLIKLDFTAQGIKIKIIKNENKLNNDS